MLLTGVGDTFGGPSVEYEGRAQVGNGQSTHCKAKENNRRTPQRPALVERESLGCSATVRYPPTAVKVHRHCYFLLARPTAAGPICHRSRSLARRLFRRQ